jgi:hypothetical protein
MHVLLTHTNVRAQGGVLEITVTDSDLDTNSNTLETASVLVEFLAGTGPASVPAAQTLTLLETNTDSGVFTGALQTAHSTSDSSRVSVYPRQEISLTYVDRAPEAVARLVVPVVPSKLGTIDTGPAATQVTYDRSAGLNIRTIDAGDTVAVTVVDADLNQDDLAPDRYDRIYTCNRTEISNLPLVLPPRDDVTFACIILCSLCCPLCTRYVIRALRSCSASAYFFSTSGSATVNVALRETADTSGIFTGRLLTRLGSSSSSLSEPMEDKDRPVLDVRYGDKLTGVYVDAAPAAERLGGSIVRVASPGVLSISPSAARPGSVLAITLTDADLDRDGLAAETYTLTAVTSRVGEGSQNVTLVETASTSGIFTGLLSTRDRASIGLEGMGFINVIEGDVVTVSYTDIYPAGHVSTSSSLMTMSPCGCATLSVSPTLIAAEALVSVTVVDTDKDLDAAVNETIYVRVVNINRPAQVRSTKCL